MAEEFSTDGMLDIYLFENEQLLEQLQERVLEQKDAECFDEDSINEIFRTMHTIKGSSGIMMFDNITAVSHKLEDVFYYLRESHPDNVPHLQLVEHVLEVEDFISGELEKIRSGDPADGDATGLVADLDKFLNMLKNGGAAAGQEEPPENVHEEPKHFYIAPVATTDSRFYKIYLTFYPTTEMANVHAYKTVYALKEIAEDLLYSPEDIISDESSAETILKEGFRILLQAQCTEEDIRQIWAEVLVYVERGEKLYLDASMETLAKAEQREAMESDEREGLVRLYLDTLLPEDWSGMDIFERRNFLHGSDFGPAQRQGTVKRTSVSSMEIWCECFGKDRSNLRRSDSNEITGILKRIGWQRAESKVRIPLYGPQYIFVPKGCSE